MKACIFRAARRLQVMALAGAIAVAAPASGALAQAAHNAKAAQGVKADQSGKKEDAAAQSKSKSVSSVVVPAPAKPNKIPPAKKAAFDAEAAKRRAWTNYRTTAPPSKVARARGGNLDADNYPGLHDMGNR